MHPHFFFLREFSISCRFVEKPRGVNSSSFFTRTIKAHFVQSFSFSAYVPWILPPQREPTTAQHALPAPIPQWAPSNSSFMVTGHIPSSPALSPPGCRPQWVNSQQFSFFTASSLF